MKATNLLTGLLILIASLWFARLWIQDDWGQFKIEHPTGRGAPLSKWLIAASPFWWLGGILAALVSIAAGLKGGVIASEIFFRITLTVSLLIILLAFQGMKISWSAWWGFQGWHY